MPLAIANPPLAAVISSPAPGIKALCTQHPSTTQHLQGTAVEHQQEDPQPYAKKKKIVTPYKSQHLKPERVWGRKQPKISVFSFRCQTIID